MKRLTLSNFKAYIKPVTVNFSDITLNVGMNSVGKSTVVQALLLMRQAYDELKKLEGAAKKDVRVLLNGPYDLQLGDFNHITTGAESFSFDLDGTKFAFRENEDKYSVSFAGEENALPNGVLFSPHFYYINAERLGPRNYQDIQGGDESSLCGYHGEHTFEVINQNSQAAVQERRRFSAEMPFFSKQLELWMDYIVPGIIFHANDDVVSRTATLRIRQTTLDTDWGSPHNYGFGISYLLPIIVTGLLAEPGSVFVVENPEAHLHPSGQSRIGKFLAQVAFSGVTVLVETHSEHVVNGARLQSLEMHTAPERICINNFSLAEDGPYVERLTLSESMDILSWPDGFFDQQVKDLAELRQLRRR